MKSLLFKLEFADGTAPEEGAVATFYPLPKHPDKPVTLWRVSGMMALSIMEGLARTIAHVGVKEASIPRPAELDDPDRR